MIYYDGLEGSSSKEIFFYFWRNIFISREMFFSREIFFISWEKFLFIGKCFLLLGTYFYFLLNFFLFSGNSIYFAWCLRFRKAISGICRLKLHVHLHVLTVLTRERFYTKPVSLNTTAWKTC